MWNNNWKKNVDYPSWGDTDVYKKTIAGGYLVNGETPRDAYMRVCTAVAKRLQRPELAETFFEYIWKGWLCFCLLYTSPSPRDVEESRMPSSA